MKKVLVTWMVYNGKNRFSAFNLVTATYGEIKSTTAYKNNDDIIDNCHLAAEEEKQKLFVALKKEGRRWNAETKHVEDIEHKSFN